MPTHDGFGDGLNVSQAERQSLHRMLMRGSGFGEWVAPAADTTDSFDEDMTKLTIQSTRHRALPSVDFVGNISDQIYADSLLEEILEEDRPRFRRYMSSRDLGLGLVDAVGYSYPNILIHVY